MSSLLGVIRSHLGVTIPLFVLYAGAVLWASGGTFDGQIGAVLVLVLALTLLTPVALGAVNRRHLRGDWRIATEAGESILRDGPADRYEMGFRGWLFLTDRRLVMCRVGGGDEVSVPLDRLAGVSVGRYAGVFATDLLLQLQNGAVERLKVEGSGEWVQRIRDAAASLPAGRA
jgi:hypothetical protein